MQAFTRRKIIRENLYYWAKHDVLFSVWAGPPILCWFLSPQGTLVKRRLFRSTLNILKKDAEFIGYV